MHNMLLLLIVAPLFEPKMGSDNSLVPEWMRDMGNQREGSCAGTGLMFCNDLFNEAPVFRRLTIIQGRILDDLTGRQPDERLRAH